MHTFFKRLLVVAVNVVVLLGALALMEFAVRAIEVRRLGLTTLLPPATMDRWTGWRNTPGYRRVDIYHNREGFRHDTEVAAEKRPNTVRIFFLGGSAAYGCEGLFKDLDPQWARLSNRDLIDVYLEKKLQQEHPECRWEVINAAVNEFRMHQHLALIESRLLRYKPDLIIFMDGHNDMSGIMSATTVPYDPYAETPHEVEFESAVYPHTLRSLFFIDANWLRNESALFAVLQRKIMARTMDEAFGTSPDRDGPMHTPVQLPDLSPALQQRARQNLGQAGYYVQMAERLQSALAHEGIEAMFSMQPELILSDKPLTPVEAKFARRMREISGPYNIYMYEQLQPLISREMAESAARNHYVYVDLRGTFQGVKEKTFTDYCHLTPLGNKLIADRLYAAMSPKLIAKLTARLDGSTSAPSMPGGKHAVSSRAESARAAHRPRRAAAMAPM